MPSGASITAKNVMVLPALVKVMVPRPEKVWVDVPDITTPDPRVYEP